MKELKNYYEACEDLKDKFLEAVHDLSSGDISEQRWIGDAIGETLQYDDYFVNMHDMVDYFKYGFTPEEFFDWYDKSTDAAIMNETYVNMRNYKKLTK